MTHFGVLSTDFQLNGEVPAVGLTLNESAEQILNEVDILEHCVHIRRLCWILLSLLLAFALGLQRLESIESTHFMVLVTEGQTLFLQKFRVGEATPISLLLDSNTQ